MPKLSPNFSLNEFTRSQLATRSGISNEPPPEIIPHLVTTAHGMELVRHHLGGRPITITSGYRCLRVNRLLNSKDSSDHVQGWAADFVVPGMTPGEIVKEIAIAQIHFHQLINEFNEWVHISFNPAMENEILYIKHEGKKIVTQRGLS